MKEAEFVVYCPPALRLVQGFVFKSHANIFLVNNSNIQNLPFAQARRKYSQHIYLYPISLSPIPFPCALARFLGCTWGTQPRLAIV